VDLFNRIATQQREQTPALKPVLPPRFAPRALGEAPWRGDTLEEAAMPASSEPRAVAGDANAGPGTLPARERHAHHAAGQHREAHAPTAAQPPQRAGAAVPLPATPHPVADATQPGQVGFTPRMPMAQPRPTVAGAPDAATAAPPAAPLSPARARTAPAAPLQRMPSGAAPLSPARVQALSPQPAQAAAAAPAPPVVHVHIDRIEVRAPAAAPARPAPARPARTAAQHSLADYLRGEGHKS
jgi:hypothetical protein